MRLPRHNCSLRTHRPGHRNSLHLFGLVCLQRKPTVNITTKLSTSSFGEELQDRDNWVRGKRGRGGSPESN